VASLIIFAWALSILLVYALSSPQTSGFVTIQGVQYPIYVHSNSLVNNTPVSLWNVTDLSINNDRFYPQECKTGSLYTIKNNTTFRYLSDQMYVDPNVTSLDALITIPTKSGYLLYSVYCNENLTLRAQATNSISKVP
ncbi:MAG: hypothetical protein KGH62_05780, partial [Candidatus Micrarchaeota archaeon]|nr:hypothetical protein [Candidatus Micrarchaeota archaeon]